MHEMRDDYIGSERKILWHLGAYSNHVNAWETVEPIL